MLVKRKQKSDKLKNRLFSSLSTLAGLILSGFFFLGVGRIAFKLAFKATESSPISLAVAGMVIAVFLLGWANSGKEEEDDKKRARRKKSSSRRTRNHSPRPAQSSDRSRYKSGPFADFID